MSFKEDTQARLRELYASRRTTKRKLASLEKRIAEIVSLAPEIAATVEDKENPVLEAVLPLVGG